MTDGTGTEDSTVFNSISDPGKTNTSTAGPVVLYSIALAWRTQFYRSLTGGSVSELSDEEEDQSQYQFEDDLEYLRSLDPRDWKDQDHYAVLGIKDLRHRATEDIIKKAYKLKILKHHPDKRKAMGEEIRPDDDYFTCITRAWETLGSQAKRRSYDSVDPYFNDNLPDEKDCRNNFYEILGKAFKENSRWSVKKPVPRLGGPFTPREKVEQFYSFWYDFDSWREYSYLDEEDKESGQDRDMRKWIEKKNKATRAKRKKEEMMRIRTLVDMAYNIDPRIKKFQQEDKDKKNAVKRAKQEAAKARQQEEKRIARDAAEKERLEKEKRESEERAKQDALKQEREVQKKALRKERKAFRDFCKANDYFAENSEESLRHMENVEKICELFKLVQLEEAMKNLQTNGRIAFLSIVEEAEQIIEAERRVNVINNDARNTPDKQTKTCTAPWSENDLQLLIKAVNLFPAGTNQRWEVVANFINQHSSSTNGVTRDAKEVLAKAKSLQSTDFSKSSLKEQANKKAFDNFIAEKKSKEAIEERMPAVTERLDHPIANGVTVESKEMKKESAPWTLAEQKLLEQALKTYPTSVPDRWDQIAACIPTRTKKECMKRYKELVELVKAKKAAQMTK
ncbi:PREDICTED: dnaJ homolog subfamily C member 2 [Cyphomyrmex costatus]|uniref:DnaJ like protein subfamily C member 2 n=1 Tax=Cyphomyrmex costatus TaxID=456900 RepID=A0A195D385_9HYME|nr:PREDICTED: dnaJ homolog subfamily C member 2 [Cyphomyrmex costatus]KYN06829.1 DnaJ like protein subfamily C member 2 [Cyphomyrmex costatus]